MVDNDTVIFTGGKNTKDFISSRRAFMVNIESRQSTHLAKLNQGRWGHACCVTRRKMAFVFGGYHRDKKASYVDKTLDTIEMIPLYPCKSAKGKIIPQKWKAFTIESLSARAEHVMSAAGNNTLMIVGGKSGTKQYLEAQFVDVENQQKLQTFSTEKVDLQHISRSYHVLPFGDI